MGLRRVYDGKLIHGQPLTYYRDDFTKVVVVFCPQAHGSILTCTVRDDGVVEGTAPSGLHCGRCNADILPAGDKLDDWWPPPT